MGRLTAEHVAERAIDAGLATPRQLQEVWGALGTRSVGVDEFLQALVRRELLTKYQVDRLLKGEKTGYFFGDYKILYLMGTGTFARVFRAAHRETGQVVAKIKIGKISISGRVEGTIVATEKIEILHTGKVIGDIATPVLVVEEGAVLEGKCNMTKTETLSAVKPAIGLPALELKK